MEDLVALERSIQSLLREVAPYRFNDMSKTNTLVQLCMSPDTWEEALERCQANPLEATPIRLFDVLDTTQQQEVCRVYHTTALAMVCSVVVPESTTTATSTNIETSNKIRSPLGALQDKLIEALLRACPWQVRVHQPKPIFEVSHDRWHPKRRRRQQQDYLFVICLVLVQAIYNPSLSLDSIRLLLSACKEPVPTIDVTTIATSPLQGLFERRCQPSPEYWLYPLDFLLWRNIMPGCLRTDHRPIRNPFWYLVIPSPPTSESTESRLMALFASAIPEVSPPSPSRFMDILRMYLDELEDRNVKLSSKDSRDRSETGCSNNNKDGLTAKYLSLVELLENPPTTHTIDDERHGQVEAAFDILLKHLGRLPEIDKRSLESNASPLHLAIRHYGYRPRLIKMLLSSEKTSRRSSNGADSFSDVWLRHRDSNGDLPLHLACRTGVSIKILQLILDATLRVERSLRAGRSNSAHEVPLCWSTNLRGLTPIHLEHLRACYRGYSSRSMPLLAHQSMYKPQHESFMQFGEYVSSWMATADSKMEEDVHRFLAHWNDNQSDHVILVPERDYTDDHWRIVKENPELSSASDDDHTPGTVLQRIFAIIQTCASSLGFNSATEKRRNDAPSCTNTYHIKELLHQACVLANPTRSLACINRMPPQQQVTTAEVPLPSMMVPEFLLPFLKLIIGMYPFQTMQADAEQGRLPLHYLVECCCSPYESLVRQYPQTAAMSLPSSQENPKRKCPWQAWTNLVHELIQAAPQALRVRDKSGRLPLHLALGGWEINHRSDYDYDDRCKNDKTFDSLTSYTNAHGAIILELAEAWPAGVGMPILDPICRSSMTDANNHKNEHNDDEKNDSNNNIKDKRQQCKIGSYPVLRAARLNLSETVIYVLLRSYPDALEACRFQ